MTVEDIAGATSPLTLSVLDVPSDEWDPFVRAHADASVYLLSGWTALAREVFRHPVFFIEARDGSGKLRGILPVVRQRGLLGDFATSIPFFNYGGALADGDEVIAKLMNRARELARQLGCSYLELRDVHARCDDWILRTDKVSMILDLPGSPQALSQQLGSKLRSQIRRAEREPVGIRRGHAELLDAFYEVFAHNMRDLGTPVYPRKFFRAILARFPANTLLLVIDHKDRPAAAGFIVMDRGRAEIPWAACRAEAKPMGLNMKLYWEVLSAAIEHGCTSFDFGRSTTDSGTFKFKQQWGAKPLQLHWHRWERTPSPSGASVPASNGRMMQYATAAWQRLPVRVANVLGPLLSPGLPW
jgi:serine/alanine adding enzyme